MALLGRVRGPNRNAGQGPAIAGMLSWQYYLIAFALGLLAWREPWAALCAALLFALLCSGLRNVRLAAFCFVMLLAAGLAAWLEPPPVPSLDSPEIRTWMTRREVVAVQGMVNESEPRDGNRLRIILDDVRCRPDGGEECALAGKLAFTWDESQFVPPPGTRITARLRVAPMRGMANHGVWDYEAWWARQGVRWRAWGQGEKPGVRVTSAAGFSPLWTGREGLKSLVAEELRPWESEGRAAVFALLFGERSWLSPETSDRIRDAGVAHSFALSGMHVGFVVLVGFGLARLVGGVFPGVYLKCPRQQLGAATGALLAILYIWLGGWSPSLIRAALMFLIWGLLYLQGRENTLFDGLLLAVALMLAVSPELVFDLRLQLSALAVLGIAGLLELQRLWRKARPAEDALALASGAGGSMERGGLFAPLWRFASKSLPAVILVSLSAELVLLPLLVDSFGELSSSLYLNAIWLPVLGLAVMPLSLAGLAAGVLPWQKPAAVLFDLASYISGAFLGLLGEMEGSGLLAVLTPMRAGWPAWVGYWCALLMLFLLARSALQRKAWRRENQGDASELSPLTLSKGALAAVALSVVLLALPSFGAAIRALDKGVSLRMLDVGQGQSLVLELPGGRRLLLDGGGFPYGSFDVGQAIVAPALTAGRPPILDGVILSHHHSDHMLGLGYPMQQFKVGFFADNGRKIPLPGGDDLAVALEKGRAPHEIWRAGDRIHLGGGLALEVLHPSELPTAGDERVFNDDSLVLRLTRHGHGLALLTGDVEEHGIAELLDSGAELRAQVLALPHHGSMEGRAIELLQRVAPAVALASAGYLNRYGLPDPTMREAVAQSGAKLYVSYECGAVTVRWEEWEEGRNQAIPPAPRVSNLREGCSR